jgi:flagellar biosynthetic protein FliO
MKHLVILFTFILFSQSLVFAKTKKADFERLPEKEVTLEDSQELQSTLVNVDKNSKLSDYLKKINTKMTSDSETLSLEDNEINKASEKSLDEENIPLDHKVEKNKKSAAISPVNKMVMAIFALILIGGIVLMAVQKMNTKQGHSEIAKNIKVLTQKSLGPKKNLMLIRVAGETILIGVTDHNINHIKTLSLMEDELPQYTEPKFQNQLKEKINQTKISDEKEEIDGFAVSRLEEVKGAITKRFSI